ncbi:MAG TPA: hypothetical protein VFV34_16115 [Blastocatellia bacterium]|nr:hypothetical protein [Blastocatellia bacterium]
MASSVATFPPEAAAYCSHCHNTVNGMLPPRPEIPQKARVLMEAIGRTNHLTEWIEELLNEAKSRKINVAAEADDLRLLKLSLHDVKVEWHAFVTDATLDKANKVFEKGVTIRDRLTKKLNKG